MSQSRIRKCSFLKAAIFEPFIAIFLNLIANFFLVYVNLSFVTFFSILILGLDFLSGNFFYYSFSDCNFFSGGECSLFSVVSQFDKKLVQSIPIYIGVILYMCTLFFRCNSISIFFSGVFKAVI